MATTSQGVKTLTDVINSQVIKITSTYTCIYIYLSVLELRSDRLFKHSLLQQEFYCTNFNLPREF